jgi:hypothetical protein
VLKGKLLQRIWYPNSTSRLSETAVSLFTFYESWLPQYGVLFFFMRGETWFKSFNYVSSSILRKVNQSAFPNFSYANKFTCDKLSRCSSQSVTHFLLPEVFFFFLSRYANKTWRTIVLNESEFIFVIFPHAVKNRSPLMNKNIEFRTERVDGSYVFTQAREQSVCTVLACVSGHRV